MLIGSVLLGTLLLAGVAGLLARRRFAVGAALLVAARRRRGRGALVQPAAGPLDALPALVTAVVGLAVLAWLVRGAAPRPRLGEADAATSRRGFLVGAGVVAASPSWSPAPARRSSGRATRSPTSRCPRPRQPLPALAAGLEQKYDGISPFVTSRAKFYRVDTNLTVPVVDVDSWTLTIDGDVDKKVTLHLRRADPDGRGRARHHAHLRQQRGRRQPGRGGPLARRTPAGRARPRRHRQPRPTRSSAPPSTASRSARRCRSPWTGATRWSRSA